MITLYIVAVAVAAFAVGVVVGKIRAESASAGLVQKPDPKILADIRSRMPASPRLEVRGDVVEDRVTAYVPKPPWAGDNRI